MGPSRSSPCRPTLALEAGSGGGLPGYLAQRTAKAGIALQLCLCSSQIGKGQERDVCSIALGISFPLSPKVVHSTRKLTNISLIKWDCLFLGGEVAVSSSSFILQGSSTHVGPYFIK